MIRGFDAEMVASRPREIAQCDDWREAIIAECTFARPAGVVVVAILMYPAARGVRVSGFETGCFQGTCTIRMCRDSSVDIATRYGLDGPGIESR